jgi:hypothetical protein
MLSPAAIFRYKAALYASCHAHQIPITPGFRLYRRVAGRTIAVPLMGSQARSTLARWQRHFKLKPTGILDAPTREKLIPSTRERIVAYARWGVENTAQIHYLQKRPMTDNTRALPRSVDCSEFATDAYQDAGAPDPNGLGYNRAGYTGTLINHGVTVSAAQARPGDLVIFGLNPTHHVAIVVEAGDDPLLVSHGSEIGPLYIRLSAERAAQGGRPVTIKSYLP